MLRILEDAIVLRFFLCTKFEVANFGSNSVCLNHPWRFGTFGNGGRSDSAFPFLSCIWSKQSLPLVGNSHFPMNFPGHFLAFPRFSVGFWDLIVFFWVPPFF